MKLKSAFLIQSTVALHLMNFEKNKPGNTLSRNLQLCKPTRQVDCDRNYGEQMLKQLLRKKREELKLPKMPSQEQDVQVSVQNEMLLDDVCSALSFCSKIVNVCSTAVCEVQLNSLTAYLKDSDNESERFFTSNRYNRLMQIEQVQAFGRKSQRRAAAQEELGREHPDHRDGHQPPAPYRQVHSEAITVKE